MTDNDKELFKMLKQLEQETLSITNARLIAPIEISKLLDDDRVKTIAHNFQKARKTGIFCEMNQTVLAEKMGVERTIISNIERGQKKAMNHILRAAVAMNISVVWLAFGDPKTNEDYRGRVQESAKIFEALYMVMRVLVAEQNKATDQDYNIANTGLRAALILMLGTTVIRDELLKSALDYVENIVSHDPSVLDDSLKKYGNQINVIKHKYTLK
ncbi:helix-turn-helix transcriptional regulator [Vibrio parahaemolyticus]|nr:helix-turn-helix transcriptional regulator [Vibrio alginolyticus]ELZ7198860.1 helix-turn-helix transcriptional regulator [Vibrio parahaemolyticus]